MRVLHPNQRNIPLRKVHENHEDIQLVKHAPSLSHSNRNSEELISQVREVFSDSRKNKSTNIKFAHDCTKFFKSEAYFHTIELEDMLGRDPKLKWLNAEKAHSL